MRRTKGFVFIELIVVLGIMATLAGIVTISLLGAQRRTSLRASVDTLVADIKGQQMKAMVGEMGGTGESRDYGIQFDAGSYTLFGGATLDPADPTNVVVPLDANVRIAGVAFPSSRIVFFKGSGEVVGYAAGSDTIDVRHDLNGEQTQLQLNQYGVVVSNQ